MLIYEGKINYEQLKKNNIDVNDLLSMLREKNYFDIEDVEYAIFEPRGELSVLPKAKQRPVVLQDVKSKVNEEASLSNVLVADGKISKSGLNEITKDETWLFKKLKIDSSKELKNIILATYDSEQNRINVHYKN